MVTQWSESAVPATSGQRRRMVRVRLNLHVALAMPDGSKCPARVVDIGVGGMHLECATIPSYGAPITVIARLNEESDWLILPAVVRWFTRGGFGVMFGALSEARAEALALFVDQVAVA